MPEKRGQPKDGAAIAVQVRVRHLPGRQLPSGEQHCFAYTITIANGGDAPVRLMARRWIITDGGEEKEVSGPGVVGETPLIAPGGEHTYTSFVGLFAPVGAMRGEYLMRGENGQEFTAQIPRFTLRAAGQVH